MARRYRGHRRPVHPPWNVRFPEPLGVGGMVDRATDVEGTIVLAEMGSITKLAFLTETSRGMAYQVEIKTPGLGIVMGGVLVQTGPGEGLLYEGLTRTPSRRRDPFMNPEEFLPQDNPFYVQVKPQGQKVQRFGPMSEADFWIEEMQEDLQPLHTGADPTFEEVGLLLRQRRMELGLSQMVLSNMLDMPKSTLQDIERGNIRSNQATLKHMAKTMAAYFEGPLPSRRTSPPPRRENPEDRFDEDSGEFEVAVENYRTFHGVDPDEYLDMNIWVPGEMVLVGVGKDVGYGILNKYSHKDGWYVHDFGPKVKIYRRAKSGERADRTWRDFPRAITSMGHNLGFTYLKGGVDGPMKEVKGAQNKYLAFTPSRRTIVVVGSKGIEYLMEGGDMRVDNWIRD